MYIFLVLDLSELLSHPENEKPRFSVKIKKLNELFEFFPTMADHEVYRRYHHLTHHCSLHCPEGLKLDNSLSWLYV